MRVGIFAPSSPVGPVELELGIEWLRGCGFEVYVHPQTLDRDFLSGGSDERRARALLDLANDPTIEVVWAARGGWGAARLFPHLDPHTITTRKTLVGYSDVTALHEYVRQAWGWRTVHAVMPASRLAAVAPAELQATVDLVRSPVSHSLPVQWLGASVSTPVQGRLVGGNLTLWASLAGTKRQPQGYGRILFLEDIGEKLYRIERYVTQLEQAGMLDGLAAVVLGDFTQCEDEANMMLAPIEDGTSFDWLSHPKVPQRRTFSLEEGLERIFGAACGARGIPLAWKLPVGHGPNFHPLDLGRFYRLDTTTLRAM